MSHRVQHADRLRGPKGGGSGHQRVSVATALALAIGLFGVFGVSGSAHAATKANANPVASASPVAFPGCSWPIETTPTKANLFGPDPSATYWTTPFITDPGNSITIHGTFPTARYISYTVYNNSFNDFTNTVAGQPVSSALADYQLQPDAGSVNPWQVASVPTGSKTNYTVTLLPGATATQRLQDNTLPMIDATPPADPTGPANVGYVIMRAYIPAGGNTTVPLPSITITHNGTSSTLPQCSSLNQPGSKALSARLAQVLKAIATIQSKISGGCTSNCPPTLQYFFPSADLSGGLFPNPDNSYIAMQFTPKPGYVVVTRGQAPIAPVGAGSGTKGNSIGASPVNWLQSPLPYQTRYWSINNYLLSGTYPVVQDQIGSASVFGGAADFQMTLDSGGYYTLVSSLPVDEPSSSSLTAASATWVPTSNTRANRLTPETQWVRNMVANRDSYPNSFAFIPRPTSPSANISPAVLHAWMGTYYPEVAQCRVQVFQSGGWTACKAATPLNP